MPSNGDGEAGDGDGSGGGNNGIGGGSGGNDDAEEDASNSDAAKECSSDDGDVDEGRTVGKMIDRLDGLKTNDDVSILSGLIDGCTMLPPAAILQPPS